MGVGYSDHRIHKNYTAAHKIRRLQCRDPRTVNAFNKCLERQYKYHNYVAANTSIFRTIIYGLPGCCYSLTECRKLENILYSDLILKMGLSSKLPLPYRYGGLSSQGMGLIHSHLQMLIEQLRIFLEHIQLDTQLGVSYQATLETAQLEVGSMSDFFYHIFMDKKPMVLFGSLQSAIKETYFFIPSST